MPGGAALGLVGAVPLAVGTNHAVRGRPGRLEPVAKSSFLLEGVKGTGSALAERKESYTQPAPKKARAIALGANVGAGIGGGRLASHALKNHPQSLKSAAAPVAGVLTGLATTPLTRKAVQHATPGYTVTAAGVMRDKKKRIPASRKANVLNEKDGKSQFRRGVVGKADLTPRQKAARIYAAGAIPGPAGPIASARMAAKLAPEGQERSAAVTQYAGGQGGKYTGGAVGAYGLAHAATKSPAIMAASQRGEQHIKTAHKAIAGQVARVPGVKQLQSVCVTREVRTAQARRRHSQDHRSARAGEGAAEEGSCRRPGRLHGGVAPGRQRRRYRRAAPQRQPGGEGLHGLHYGHDAA